MGYNDESTVLRASDVMTAPVIAVRAHASLTTVWDMLRHKPFHHLLVMEGGDVVGVVDDRMLVAAWPPAEPAAPHQRTVGEILPREVMCVRDETPLPVVAEVMMRGRCDALPVLDGDGEVTGLVTAMDVVACVARQAAHVA